MIADELFLAFLAQHDDQAWLRTVDRLESAIHPVDRTATRIWFHFYPLALQRAMDTAPDPVWLARKLLLSGTWRLADQIDRSHAFLHGHRYWREVKAAVCAFAVRAVAPNSLDLGSQVQELARALAGDLGVSADRLVGIVAVGMRTLQQVGLDQLARAPGDVDVPTAWAARGPDQVLAARARDDRQGVFGVLRGDRKRWSVVFDERDPAARFPLVHSQQIASAAALDARDYRARDSRCSEGPIPVECRSCSCGTCWVGVLGGAEKLSVMEDREREKLAACGYGTSDEPRPLIRLACMAEAYGTVTIVIPPWNGQLGRLVRGTAMPGNSHGPA